MNKLDKFRTRFAYLVMAENMQADTYMTLAANTQMGVAGFKLKLKSFFGRLDRTYLGPRWMKKSFNERTDGIGFIEKVNSHIHVHLALKTPPNAYLWNLKMNTEEIWNKICLAGSYDVQMINGLRGLTGYNTKEQKRSDYDWHDQVVLLRDFAA